MRRRLINVYLAALWYAGAELERIDSSGVILPPYEHPQHVISTCQLSNGAVALVEEGWLFTKRTKTTGMIYNVSVIGDDGTVDYNAATSSIKLWTKERTEEIECDDLDKHFERVHAMFAQSIEQGKLVGLASGRDGLKATEAAYEALASAHRGKATTKQQNLW